MNDPKACVLRELKEELSVTQEMLEDLQFRYVALRRTQGEIRQNYYFFGDLKEDAVLKSDCSDCSEGSLEWVPFDSVLKKEMPFTAKYMLEHYMSTGRFDDKVYAGVTTPDGIVFTELEDFSNDRA